MISDNEQLDEAATSVGRNQSVPCYALFGSSLENSPY